MPATLTIREKIFQDVVIALKAISVVNGFDNNIQSVTQEGLPNSLKDMPTIIVAGGRETAKEDAGFNMTFCVTEIHLLLFIRVDEGSTTAPDTTLNSLLGDIKKKLKQDIARSGNAVDTKITTVEPFDSIRGQSECGLVITVEVDYRHQELDPKVAM